MELEASFLYIMNMHIEISFNIFQRLCKIEWLCTLKQTGNIYFSIGNYKRAILTSLLVTTKTRSGKSYWKKSRNIPNCFRNYKGVV